MCNLLSNALLNVEPNADGYNDRADFDYDHITWRGECQIVRELSDTYQREADRLASK